MEIFTEYWLYLVIFSIISTFSGFFASWLNKKWSKCEKNYYVTGVTTLCFVVNFVFIGYITTEVFDIGWRVARSLASFSVCGFFCGMFLHHRKDIILENLHKAHQKHKHI